MPQIEPTKPPKSQIADDIERFANDTASLLTNVPYIYVLARAVSALGNERVARELGEAGMGVEAGLRDVQCMTKQLGEHTFQLHRWAKKMTVGWEKEYVRGMGVDTGLYSSVLHFRPQELPCWRWRILEFEVGTML